MKVLLLFILFAVWMNPIHGAADYQRVAERSLFNGEKLFEYRLANGLRILLLPRHQAKVLSYQIWFEVGSIHEKMDAKLKKTGLAHLFEHMMYRGTKKYPDGKFDEIAVRMGGERMNATTHYYRTNYFESIPSPQLEAIMELESDRMRDLDLTKDPFEKEKGAVVGELRRHLDSPGSLAHDELMRLAFDVAPFHWTVIGTEEEIRGFTLEEAKYFYRIFYAPNNATLIVVGDVDEERLLKLAVKYYGDMKPQALPEQPIPVEPPQKKERRIERTHLQATSEILLMGYRIPPITSEDIVPLSLLSTHLSAGMEGSLRKLLVDSGVAVSAVGAPSNQPDLFEFSVHLAENHHASEALKILDREISSLQKKAISKALFERSLNQELLSLYSEIADNNSLATWFGENLMLSGNYMRGFEIIEQYKSITPAHLQRAAKKYLNKDQRTVVIIRPEKKGKS